MMKPAVADLSFANVRRGYHVARTYVGVPGFCRAELLDEVRAHNHVLTPGRYVGVAAQEADGEPFTDKMARPTSTLEEQFVESSRLEVEIRASLTGTGSDSMDGGGA